MAVREGLLLLLAERPRHGYELKTEFELRTGTLWQLNTGQVYTTLERLRRDGLVEAAAPEEVAHSTDERRRAYRLTDGGRAVAREWLDAEAPDGAPPRDELVMKVLLAAHGDPDEALRVIDAHRHTLLARLQAVRRSQLISTDGDDDGGDLAARMCDDVLVVRIEADLRWLDMCVDRLRARASTAPRKGKS
jgi:DNA-binding PadR family transcriptional regulator